MTADRRPRKREYRGWSFELPADKSKVDDLMLYMPDSGKVSDNSIPSVAKDVSKKSKTGFNPQELLKRAGYKSADEVRTETLANDLFGNRVRSEERLDPNKPIEMTKCSCQRWKMQRQLSESKVG